MATDEVASPFLTPLSESLRITWPRESSIISSPVVYSTRFPTSPLYFSVPSPFATSLIDSLLSTPAPTPAPTLTLILITPVRLPSPITIPQPNSELFPIIVAPTPTSNSVVISRTLNITAPPFVPRLPFKMLPAYREQERVMVEKRQAQLTRLKQHLRQGHVVSTDHLLERRPVDPDPRVGNDKSWKVRLRQWRRSLGI